VTDPARLRDEFLLDPDVVFLNHGSFGACPRDVFARYQEWQAELERRPVEFLARRLPVLLAEARVAVGSYIGADPDDLVFVPNATTGVNLAAWGLALQPGDEVLSTSLEYGGLDLAWDHVCAHAPARYVRMPVTLPVESEAQIVEEVWSGVTDRTRALFLSHVTSETALRLPIEELCGRARERGIRTVIDGAHVPGQLPLDLAALDVDYYAGNCHKWQFHFPQTALDADRPEFDRHPTPNSETFRVASSPASLVETVVPVRSEALEKRGPQMWISLADRAVRSPVARPPSLRPMHFPESARRMRPRLGQCHLT
jgi:selenocysteine lyase/cysteine desulfurase